MKKKIDPEKGPLNSEDFIVDKILNYQSPLSTTDSEDNPFEVLMDLLEDIQAWLFDQNPEKMKLLIFKLREVRDSILLVS